MKKIVIFILIINFLLSQSTGYSLYGIGEFYKNNYPASIALGNIDYFSGNTVNVVESSSSSYWKSSLTRFIIHTGLSNISEKSGIQNSQHKFTSFSISFPVGRKKVLGFGLKPMYRTNSLSITDNDFNFIGADESPSGTPIATKNTYKISGGISNLYILYSQQLTSKLSIGIQYSKLLGSQIRNDQLYTYDITFNNELDIEYLDNEIVFVNYLNVFNGNEFSFEGRFTLNNQEFVSSFSLIGNSKIKSFKTVSNETDTNSYYQPSFLHNIGLGYQFSKSNRSAFIIELHKLYPFKISSEIILFDISPPTENSFHLGYFRQINNSRPGIWNKIVFRSGVFIKHQIFNSPVFTNKSDFLNFGLTYGLGLEYLNSAHSIDISVKIGKRESIIFLNDFENYISLHIGIISGEKWFIKRREK